MLTTIHAPEYIINAMLYLERGIAGFPRFYRQCPLKMHPALNTG